MTPITLLSPVSPVESNMSIVLDVLAVAEGPPQSLSNRGLILHIELPEDFLDSLGGLLSMIEGHIREQMMGHVSICDMMEEVVQGGAKGSIYCAEGTSQPGPFFVIKVWHIDICVLEVGDQDQVIVDNKIGYKVEREPGSKAKSVDDPNKDTKIENKAEVAYNDLPEVFWFIEFRVGIKMAARLVPILGRASSIYEQISWHPSHK